MKTIIKFIAAAFCVGALAPMGMTSCTDMGGDGIDSVLWQGSQNPENNNFRNPVFEPSLEGGTVVKGASMYVALSATTQWSTGLTNICPALTSTNLMAWQRANDGFTAEGNPTWGEGRVNSLSADYARTLKVNYWMFYTLEGSNSIGYAFATSAQGPYTDGGLLMSAADAGVTTVKNPFFIVVSTNYYLCYTTENGTFIQKLTLKGSNVNTANATLSGTPTKIGNASVDDVAIFRKSSSELYLLFTVAGASGSEIRYARATTVTGPYLDKSGANVADDSKGELLIESGTTMLNPGNPMRVFLNSEQTHAYVAYNATEAGNGQMKSGYARRPMMVSPVELTEDGWFKTSVKAEKGWATPKFE